MSWDRSVTGVLRHHRLKANGGLEFNFQAAIGASQY